MIGLPSLKVAEMMAARKVSAYTQRQCEDGSWLMNPRRFMLDSRMSPDSYI